MDGHIGRKKLLKMLMKLSISQIHKTEWKFSYVVATVVRKIKLVI